MLLVALHKVLGFACSPTLALFFLLPPLVTAHPASKIGSSAFSQQRKCRSYNLMHGQQLCRVGHSNFMCAYAQGTWPMSKTSCLLDRGGGLYAPGASAYPCGGFCRVHGAFQVSPWKERELRCPKRGRLAWTLCDSETSFQVREVFFSRAFQTFHWSHFVFYKWLNINWGRELNLRSSKSLWVLYQTQNLIFFFFSFSYLFSPFAVAYNCIKNSNSQNTS